MKKNDKKNNDYIFIIIQIFQVLALLLLKWNKIEMSNIIYIILLVFLFILAFIVFYMVYTGSQSFLPFALFIIFVCLLLNNFDYYRVSYNYKKHKKSYYYVVNNLDKFEKKDGSISASLDKYSFLSVDNNVNYGDDGVVMFNVYDEEYLVFSNNEELLKEHYGDVLKSYKKVDDEFYYVVCNKNGGFNGKLFG